MAQITIIFCKFSVNSECSHNFMFIPSLRGVTTSDDSVHLFPWNLLHFTGNWTQWLRKGLIFVVKHMTNALMLMETHPSFILQSPIFSTTKLPVWEGARVMSLWDACTRGGRNNPEWLMTKSIGGVLLFFKLSKAQGNAGKMFNIQRKKTAC